MLSSENEEHVVRAAKLTSEMIYRKLYPPEFLDELYKIIKPYVASETINHKVRLHIFDIVYALTELDDQSYFLDQIVAYISNQKGEELGEYLYHFSSNNRNIAKYYQNNYEPLFLLFAHLTDASFPKGIRIIAMNLFVRVIRFSAPKFVDEVEIDLVEPGGITKCSRSMAFSLLFTLSTEYDEDYNIGIDPSQDTSIGFAAIQELGALLSLYSNTDIFYSIESITTCELPNIGCAIAVIRIIPLLFHYGNEIYCDEYYISFIQYIFSMFQEIPDLSITCHQSLSDLLQENTLEDVDLQPFFEQYISGVLQENDLLALKLMLVNIRKFIRKNPELAKNNYQIIIDIVSNCFEANNEEIAELGVLILLKCSKTAVEQFQNDIPNVVQYLEAFINEYSSEPNNLFYSSIKLFSSIIQITQNRDIIVFVLQHVFSQDFAGMSYSDLGAVNKVINAVIGIDKSLIFDYAYDLFMSQVPILEQEYQPETFTFAEFSQFVNDYYIYERHDERRLILAFSASIVQKINNSLVLWGLLYPIIDVDELNEVVHSIFPKFICQPISGFVLHQIIVFYQNLTEPEFACEVYALLAMTFKHNDIEEYSFKLLEQLIEFHLNSNHYNEEQIMPITKAILLICLSFETIRRNQVEMNTKLGRLTFGNDVDEKIYISLCLCKKIFEKFTEVFCQCFTNYLIERFPLKDISMQSSFVLHSFLFAAEPKEDMSVFLEMFEESLEDNKITFQSSYLLVFDVLTATRTAEIEGLFIEYISDAFNKKTDASAIATCLELAQRLSDPRIILQKFEEIITHKNIGKILKEMGLRKFACAFSWLLGNCNLKEDVMAEMHKVVSAISSHPDFLQDEGISAFYNLFQSQ